jgi:hypothetical protein
VIFSSEFARRTKRAFFRSSRNSEVEIHVGDVFAVFAKHLPTNFTLI